MAASDSARTRAQAAYAIANALAGGLVGASLFTLFQNAALPARFAASAAVLIWIVSAGLYVRAIASPVPTLAERAAAPNADAFVTAVLENARTDRIDIETRQHRANVAAVVAVTVTAVSFGLLLFGPSATVNATIDLTPSESAQMSTICGHELTSVTGAVDRASIDSSVLVVAVPSSTCGVATTLRIPMSGVADLRST